MENTRSNLTLSAIVSIILLLPLVMLALVNRRNINNGCPFPLFLILWLLPAVFVFILMPMVLDIRAGKRTIANPIVPLIRGA